MNSTIIEETKEIVLVFNEYGEILYGNRSAKEKLGYTKEELERCNMSEIFWKEFQQEDGTYGSFDKGKLLDIDETAMYQKNSACFPVEIRLLSLPDGTDCLLAQDITRRKNMDARLRKLREEEEINYRVRNEFIANVTHELRTPVNGIRGHVTTLLETTQEREKRKTLDVILYCCDNMSAIINNILDFSKLEAGKFVLEEAEFDFYKMMDQVIATHMPEIHKKELHFNAYIDKNIPQYMVGDALRINQILNNLLSNAVKFTMVGQVSVDVSQTMKRDDEIELFFIVRDSGIGISKEEKDTLFQSFKQVDASITRRFGGSGLGLSITKQLVEMMNGTIHLESEKGKGSSFSFNIKLRTSQNEMENKAVSEAYKKWDNLKAAMEQGTAENSLKFGSKDNRAEIKRRMEKLVLSIELEAWDRAETLAETLKVLIEDSSGDMKRRILRLEMAIRKENYDKSMEAYEKLKETIEEKIANISEEV